MHPLNIRHLPASAIELYQTAKRVDQKPPTISIGSKVQVALDLFNIIGTSVLSYPIGGTGYLYTAVSEVTTDLLV